MSTLEPEGLEVRRLEVITGTGRRRRFSDKDKARIVEETLAPGAVVSAVARRYGLTPQQVFTWRRQARAHSSSGQDWKAPAFVLAMIDTAVPPMDNRPLWAAGQRRLERLLGAFRDQLLAREAICAVSSLASSASGSKSSPIHSVSSLWRSCLGSLMAASSSA